MRWILFLALLLPITVAVGCNQTPEVADDATYETISLSIGGMT